MRHIFEAEQWLPYRVETVFAFFANPENLPRLMPAWQKARIEEASFAPPPPRPVAADPALRIRSIAAGVGTKMTISFKPFPYSPMRVPWDAEITDFVWNDHFCDVQNRGPFAYWKHCHRVHPETRANEGGELVEGTLLRDAVEYEMHFGALGNFAHTVFARRQMRKIFEFRQKKTAALLPLMRERRSVLSSAEYE
jgi:ligand-binding SRPBCC domain-containing protein